MPRVALHVQELKSDIDSLTDATSKVGLWGPVNTVLKFIGLISERKLSVS